MYSPICIREHYLDGEGDGDLAKPNGSPLDGAIVGRGPQSKLGGEACAAPDADGLLVGARLNFGAGVCLPPPPPPRRCGPRSLDGESPKDGRGVQAGGCCDGVKGDDERDRPSPGLHGSAFTTGF